MDIVTYKLSQKYADKVAAGFSSVRVDGLDIIFTLNDGKTATVTVPAPKDGEDGVSITNVSLNQQSHLICTLSDGTAIDAGLVHQGVDGKDGKDGADGTDGKGIVSIEKTATVGLVDTYTITYTDGTTSTFKVTNGSGGGNTADPVLSNSAFEITDEEDNVLFAVTNQGHIKTKKFDSEYIGDNEKHDIEYALRNGQWNNDSLIWHPNIVCNAIRIRGPFDIIVSDDSVLYSAYSYTNKLDSDYTGATKILEEDTTRKSWSYTGTDYVGFNIISANGIGSELTIFEPLYKRIQSLQSPNVKDNKENEHKAKAIRNAIFLGDSITHGVYSYYKDGIKDDAHRCCAWYWNRTYKTMPDYFLEYSGACVNNAAGRGSGYVIEGRYSAGGNNVSGTGPFYGNLNRKRETYNFAEYDFIGIMEGINDYIQHASLGTPPTDTQSTWTPQSGTVTGNLALFIKKALAENPLCKIVVYTPYNAWGQVAKGEADKGGYTSEVRYGDYNSDYALGSGSYTLSQLIDAVDKVCKYYHIEHVDLTESNICNRETIKDIMIEGLHSSLESMPKLAAEIFADKGYGE